MENHTSPGLDITRFRSLSEQQKKKFGWVTPVLPLAGVFVGLGYGTFMSNGQAICVKLVREVRIGVAVSTYFVALDLGLGVGPYLLGALQDTVGFSGIYGICGVAAAGCALLYYLLYARRRDAAGEEEMLEENISVLESDAEV